MCVNITSLDIANTEAIVKNTTTTKYVKKKNAEEKTVKKDTQRHEPI